MVKQNLSLTEIVEQGDFYLSSVNVNETKEKILELIKRFKLDLVYDSMKGTAEWSAWCKVSDKVKIYYEECVKTGSDNVNPRPRIYLRDWADEGKKRVAVIKIERDVVQKL